MSNKAPTVVEFFKRFPDDESCLVHLWETRFGKDAACPKCGEVGQFKRLAKLPAWTCNCGHHIHPMVGTPFEQSRTPLQKWFYAMYLFTTSRHGVPAKELQRQLSVTYKTAWRMGHEIRKYMADVDGDPPLSGTVEVDETYVGGRKKGHKGKQNRKAAVMGMVSRGDDVHINTIEGYWSRVKNSICGTHVHVSKKHMQKYLGEFEFRFNRRKQPQAMFDRLLSSF
ncbi:MAG: IS1595 family transposase [Rhodospirillaceae bacterium]